MQNMCAVREDHMHIHKKETHREDKDTRGTNK